MGEWCVFYELYVCVSVAQVLYQRPDSLRVLCCILAFRVFALFWIETTNVLHGVCWSHSSSFMVTASNALVNFTFHICSNCSFSPPTSLFSCAPNSISCCSLGLPHLWQLRSSAPCQPLLCLVGWPTAGCQSGTQSPTGPKSPLFSISFGGVSHWDLGTSSPFAAQMFPYTIPATLFCLSVYMLA